MIYASKHAECYDLFYQEKPYREEAQYAARLIKARFPDAKTLLDLGCGTGMRSLELARLGFKVCGVDQSPSMLAAARHHLSSATDVSPADVEFQNGDISTFRTDSQCDAIISLFHVFSYLTTEEALNQAIECAFANLNPGGVLLIDYWHGPGVVKDPPAIRTKVVDNARLRVERTTVPQDLPDKHLVKLTVSLRIIEKDTGVPNVSEERYTMRYWFPDEVEEVLASAGFKDVQHYAWMKPLAPRSEDWQACTIASKRGE
jgi:SAM-dependent methyltransferase